MHTQCGGNIGPKRHGIFFHSRPAGHTNLYIVNVETGGLPALTTGLTETYILVGRIGAMESTSVPKGKVENNLVEAGNGGPATDYRIDGHCREVPTADDFLYKDHEPALMRSLRAAVTRDEVRESLGLSA